MMGFDIANDPMTRLYNFVDVATSMPLNIAMLVGGLGLLGLKSWGRTTSVWVAYIKLIRAVALLLFSVFVVAPMAMKALDKQFGQMGAQIQQQGGPGAARAAGVMKTMTATTAAAMTGGYVFYYVCSAIYPVITLIVLAKPGVRAACAAPKPKPESGEFS
jgi:hypothetical protein